MTDYSQAGEQEIILANTPPTGRFLDIGAFHPTILSNTRALYERGWGGVMVEPGPAQFLSLLAAYKDDPHITLVQAAVDEHYRKGGLVDFYLTDDAVSTTSAAWHEKWKNTAAFHGKVLVAAVSLREILALGPFEFVNIDVEGQSADLLLELLLYPTHADAWPVPKCICVEHDDRAEELEAAAVGYRTVLKHSCNLILARE